MSDTCQVLLENVWSNLYSNEEQAVIGIIAMGCGALSTCSNPNVVNVPESGPSTRPRSPGSLQDNVGTTGPSTTDHGGHNRKALRRLGDKHPLQINGGLSTVDIAHNIEKINRMFSGDCSTNNLHVNKDQNYNEYLGQSSASPVMSRHLGALPLTRRKSSLSTLSKNPLGQIKEEEGESGAKRSTVPKLPPLLPEVPCREQQESVRGPDSWLAESQPRPLPMLPRPPPPPNSPKMRWAVDNHLDNNGAKLLWEAQYDGVGRLSNICDVAFLRQECLAVSQDATEKTGLQLYEVCLNGYPGPHIGEPEVRYPRGVCMDRSGHIAMTDAATRTVKFMDTSGTYLGSWKNDKFQLPAGIAQTKEGQYVVADERGGAKAIGLYSGRGQVIRKFGQTWFDCPWYVAVDHYNRVIVSEQSVSGVVVFDNHGRYLFKFGTHGGGDGQLNFQSGITVDSQNNILVADSDNYRVSMFSPDGYFVKHVVSHMDSRPISLSVYNPQGLLSLVTDSRLYMYQLSR